MTTAVFPGTFDPITHGHVDIVERALTFSDRVIVLVAHNSSKAPLLDARTRVGLAEASLFHLDGVEVHTSEGLLVDVCRELGADVIVKGLRGGSDFDAERPMALMNRAVGGIETVFVMGDSALAHIASSLVKDVARHGGRIDSFVPEAVATEVYAAVAAE